MSSRGAGEGAFFPKLFPLLGSLRGYGKASFHQDFVAGLTTAVLLVPQGMAYALLAGLPPVVGLYAALIPAMGYALLGTSRQLSVGPVAMDSLLVAAGVSAIAETGTAGYLEAAILLALCVGVLQLALGLLRMGFLVNFLSGPVISGFTSAAALLIALSQVKHMLGVSLESSPTAWGLLSQLPEAMKDFSALTLGIGIAAVATLAVLKRYAKKLPAPLIVVSLGTLAVYFGDLSGQLKIVGEVPDGLPPLRMPRVDLELVGQLLPTSLSIALVAFMESIAVSKTYARKNKYALDNNRELIALGVSNLLGSFFSGYPVTGGFSRTAVNAQAGARTQIASLVTVFFVGASLLFLTPLFFYLPKAALSAIIVFAVVGLIDLAEVRRLKKIKRSDLVLLALTFLATLGLGAAPGLGVGVVASLGWLVYRTTRPHIAVLGRVPGTSQFRNLKRYDNLITYPGILLLRMDAQSYFGNVQFLKETLADLEAQTDGELRAVVLDASAINAIDSSGEAALRELVEEHRSRGVAFYLAGVKGPVRDVLQSSGLAEELGEGYPCLSVHDAVKALSLRGEVDSTSSSASAASPGPNGFLSAD